MSEARSDISDTRAPGMFARCPDLGSAQATLIVGTVFVVVFGALYVIGRVYRRYPILMAVFTLAAIIAGVLVIT